MVAFQRPGPFIYVNFIGGINLLMGKRTDYWMEMRKSFTVWRKNKSFFQTYDSTPSCHWREEGKIGREVHQSLEMYRLDNFNIAYQSLRMDR